MSSRSNATAGASRSAELGGEYPGRLQVISGDALEIDERAEAGEARTSSPICPTMSAPRCCCAGWGRLAAVVVVADPDVPARGRRTDRRQGGSEHYGRLSVAAQWRAARELPWPCIARLSSRRPRWRRPSCISCRPRACRGRRRCLERLTAAAFGQRRKMLRSSLKACPARWMRWRRSESIPNGAPKRSASRNLSRWRGALS